MTGGLYWVGSVSGEGGPLLVAATHSFAQWRGATASPGGQRTVHLFGQFTRELPERYRPNGPVGHQHIDCGTFEGAQAMLEALVQHVLVAWPGTQISRDALGVQLTRPDHRTMQAELSPSSEYGAACEAGDGAEAWCWSFGDDATALLWEMEGGGVAHVGMDDSQREIVLLRTWVDDDRGELRARALVQDRPEEEEIADAWVEVADGALVVAWAPVAFDDLRGPTDAAALHALADDAPRPLPSEAFAGAGLILRVTPGRYTVHVGSHESDEGEGDEGAWCARWCRLRSTR